MEEASQKIENVVKGLLEYSRPQIFEPEEIVLNSVIEKSYSFVNYKLEKQNIKFENNIEDKELTIYGSSHQLEQVFVNLFINSIDAIDERKKLENLSQGRIIFDFEKKEKAFELRFTDNGIGIKAENLKDIFDPFYTSKEVGKGTGLGLSVSSKIINSHKGTMSVSSEYLKGTTFIISLPKDKD
jgi:signal transduction histidine kinase